MLTGEDQEDQETVDKYLVVSSKRNCSKIAPQLQEELNFIKHSHVDI
uniref:Uncharacterized protein n=1 Tax=Anguilla anguilla TaxID=7936 RepID=A0A0E9UCD2_ANGAN